MTQREMVDNLNRELADRGQIIEGGWRAFEILSLQGCSEVQRTEMRKAYFLGAQHLWSSMMSALDPAPGTEPTELDMERFTKINAELEKFIEEMKKL